jgi:5'-nucleotidase / UDP-sugar diphosphatase
MAPLTLQILHASDMEAGIPALTDAVNFSTVINALRDDYANTLTLSSGDNYLPGPFFSAASDPGVAAVLGGAGVGRADIAILNALGFQASTLGNHEFDLGTTTIADLLRDSRTATAPGNYRGTAFPYLSGNLNFSADASLRSFVVADGQAPRPNSLTQSVVITVGGERIGIVGATTPTLASISSPGPGVVIEPQVFGNTPTSAQLDALAGIIQADVNALTATGINKVIVMGHMQQLFIERDLAKRLRDVDVIIAGGSHTVLADSTDRLRPGDTADGLYPLIEQSPTGAVLVVNGASNYEYVGRLVIDFDANGAIDLTKLNPAINGSYATDTASVAALTAVNLAGGKVATPDATVVAITDALRSVIAAKDGNLFGSTPVFLNGTRGSVRSEETNLGNLTADANLFAAKQVDSSVVISLKNGGGIRDNIGQVSGSGGDQAVEFLPPPANPLANKPAGAVSQLDIENSLRFNNSLSLVTVTAAQLKDLMEHGVSGVRPGATPGAFPQIGGFAFSFDATKTARSATVSGDRIRSLAVQDATGGIADIVVVDGKLIGDPNRTFRMVTLNFLAGGGDGYPFAAATNRVDITATSTANATGKATFAANASEQDAFAEYLAAGATIQSDTSSALDRRVQNLGQRSDGVLGLTAQTGTVIGSDRNDTLYVTGNGNLVLPGEGNDQVIALGTDNRIFAGSGFDQITIGSGVAYGGEGANTITVGAGDSKIYAGAGNDTVTSGNGNNEVFVGEGNNRVTTGSGNDLIGLGAGNDIINAGDGTNRIYAGDGNDLITTGSGDDLVYGGSGNNIITTGAGNDKIYAEAGDDIVTSGNGNNEVFVGEGNNRVTTGSGNDVIGLGAGNDIINAGDGTNRIYAGDGNNQIMTGAGDDLIYSGSGNDIILTGAGNDMIYSGTGSNQINAGVGTDFVGLSEGANIVTLNAGLGSVTIIGFGADDRLVLAAGSVPSELTIARNGHDTLISKGTDLFATLQGTSVSAPMFI